jgi:hypothetical protein
LAGLILWDAKVKYGRERAAASVLEVVNDDAEDGGFEIEGDGGTAGPPTVLAP